MTTTAIEPDKMPEIIDKENPGHGAANFTGLLGKIVFICAVSFSLFQIYNAAFSPLSSQVLRSVHVGFLLLLSFLLFRFSNNAKRDHIPWYDWIFAIAGFVLGLYHWIYEADLIQRAGDPTVGDIVVGCIVVGLIFEGSRRIMGWELPLMCAVFIPYAIWGRQLPGFMAHRGFDFEQVVDVLFLGTEGIYGTPTFVSATYIFLFILFGAFLEKAGMIDLFNRVAMGTVGHHKGGPAKVAVVSSGFMGTINGSGVANVLTVGQFTIPLMIRFGYRPVFAGAVEATASMGGQIMPPVMGAVAFIMAETIGVPYSEVAIAAAIPAALYYGSAFWMVHLEAGKQNLTGMPKEECPSAWAAIKEKWHLALPLVVLVFMLFHGFTPLLAGVVGLALTAVLILGAEVSNQAKAMAVRLLFWIFLGLVAAGVYRLLGGAVEQASFAMVALLVVATAFFKGGRATQKLLISSMADAAKSALGVGMACALVGVLIGIAQMTGLANDIARGILAVAGDNLLLALIMTMIACIILGTGLPTIPNYIITSAMAAPVLLEMGVPLIVSHMFCFYFGIMADLTPPVALAALAAQSIAKAPHIQIGWVATKIGMAGYVVPFMAVYTPALMLQGGTLFDTGYVLTKAVISVALWGGAALGWLRGPLNWPERLVATAAAFLLVVSDHRSEIAGFVLAAAIIGWHLWRTRATAKPA